MSEPKQTYTIDEVHPTPIFNALRSKKTELIPEFVSHGVPLDTADRFGQTALHRAAAIGSAEGVKVIIETAKEVYAGKDAAYKAFVNAKEQRHSTALHIISRSHLQEFQGKNIVADVMVELAKGGADFSLKDENGKTALQHLSEDPTQEAVFQSKENPDKYYNTLKRLEAGVRDNIEAMKGKPDQDKMLAFSNLAVLATELEKHTPKKEANVEVDVDTVGGMKPSKPPSQSITEPSASR